MIVKTCFLQLLFVYVNINKHYVSRRYYIRKDTFPLLCVGTRLSNSFTLSVLLCCIMFTF